MRSLNWSFPLRSSLLLTLSPGVTEGRGETPETTALGSCVVLVVSVVSVCRGCGGCDNDDDDGGDAEVDESDILLANPFTMFLTPLAPLCKVRITRPWRLRDTVQSEVVGRGEGEDEGGRTMSTSRQSPFVGGLLPLRFEFEEGKGEVVSKISSSLAGDDILY